MIQVRDRLIGSGHPTLVIAEMASTHEGKTDLAHRLVDAAAEAGAEAVQLQLYVAEHLVSPDRWDFPMTKEYEIAQDDWPGIIAHAQEAGMLVWANVFDKPSLGTALRAGADVLKLHCSDTSNPVMLDAVARTGKPVSLSLGGTTPDEAAQALFRVREGGADDVILMHGFQAFPTATEDSRLGYLRTLRQMFGCVVGYQDHTDGGDEMALVLPLVAIALGASILEKHYTLNRADEGPDYQSALDPDVLARFIERVKETDRALGTGHIAPFSDPEQAYRERMKKHLVAARRIEAGEVLAPDMVSLMRVDGGLLASAFEQALGCVARRHLEAYEPINLADIRQHDET
jgi:sialic acid synthase SpsE